VSSAGELQGRKRLAYALGAWLQIGARHSLETGHWTVQNGGRTLATWQLVRVARKLHPNCSDAMIYHTNLPIFSGNNSIISGAHSRPQPSGGQFIGPQGHESLACATADHSKPALLRPADD